MSQTTFDLDKSSQIKSKWPAGAWLALLAVVSGYLGLTIHAVRGAGMAPAWSDELVYQATGRSYACNGILQDAVLLRETTANLWGLGSHGFAYTVADGLVIRALGASWNVKLTANALYVLAAAGLIVLCLHPVWPGQLPASLLVLLTTFILPIYAFTYMQEVCHLTIAVAVWAALKWTAQSDDRRVAVTVYFLVVMTASLARPNWVLALVGLLPFARSPTQLLGYFALTGIGVLVAAASLPFFHAPYPFGFLPNALEAISTEGISGFAARVIDNVQLNGVRYFGIAGSPSFAYLINKYLFAAILTSLLWCGFQPQCRIAWSIGLMALAQFAALLLFYDAFNWREQRVLAPFGVLGGLALVQCWPRNCTAIFLALTTTIWSWGVLRNALPVIKEHRNAARVWRDSADEVAAVGSIASTISGSDKVTVMLPFGSFSNTVLMSSLPVRSTAGAPIRYTMNLDGDGFKRFGKIQVQYALAFPGMSVPNAVERLRTRHFSLYEFSDRPQPPPPGVTIRNTSPAAN